jgi:Cu2+-exporting ATPase
MPRIVHETATRIRFRWNRLLAPSLDPDYLEAWLSNLPGVTEARINPGGRSLVIVYDGSDAHRRGLLQAFSAIPEKIFNTPLPAASRRRPIDVLAHGAAALAVPFLPQAAQAVAGTALGLPHVLRGMDTLVNRGLKVRVLDMATIGLSLLRADFTTAASISAMVVLGEYLRTMSDDRSNALLKRLIADPIDRVWVDRDGEETGVPFNEVETGDVVVCATGDMVPVDGDIVHGSALVDRSSITGESAPEIMRKGDEITSGCAVVEGRIRIKASRTGTETNMARIAEFMTQAMTEQSGAEVKSERLADSLTPLTLGLGAALYAATGDPERALAALTVDFACAVKYPAPVVIKTSMHAGAKQDVIFKSRRAIEALGEANAVVFDKTGTLTRGELSVTDVIPAPGQSEETFLKMAAAVEDRHGHPMGRAIIMEAKKLNLTPGRAKDVDLTVAHGVSGTVRGKLVRVGSRHFISDDCNVDCSALSDRAAKLRAEGKSLVYASVDGRLLGVAALRDTIRPEAEGVVESLRDNGIKKIVLLTGDHAGTADAFADRFPHVDEVRAELTPEEKASVVESLRGEGYRVAMVGDGINDAPAFTAAHVGICMSRSTGLARDSAQVVLAEDSLHGLAHAHAIARRASRILQNCFNEGVLVNAGLLLAASLGYLRPAAAAALHNANTFAVLGAAAWAASGKTRQ